MPAFVLVCTGVLEEWDLFKLSPSQSIQSCNGPIWCLEVSSSNWFIAVGYENGQVIVLLFT